MFTITSKEHEHSCQVNEENNKPDDKPKQIGKRDIIQLSKALIYNNIEKPLSFHISNLRQNDIDLTVNQIKWQLQKIREDTFPKEDIFLNYSYYFLRN